MTSEGGRTWTLPRVAGQVALSLVMVGAMVPWALLSLLLFVLRCDDNCSGTEADDWRYAGQALLAGAGLVAGVAALALGFTARRDAFWTAFAVSGLVGTLWVAWVTSGGF